MTLNRCHGKTGGDFVSRFSRFDAMLGGEGGHKGAEVKNTLIPDPRPDLTEDSYFWIKFLTLAAEESRPLFKALHGFRCCGTRLVKATSGQLAGLYVLRPDVDPSGDRAWTSLDEYEKWKTKYLKPLEPQLLKVLEQFNQRVRESA